MKVFGSQFSVLSGLLLGTLAAYAQEEKKAPPVEFPKLETFEPLWKRSIFTTKDLPAPEEPGGPNFADNLSLSGIYEIDGGVVAVLVDRVTSQVMEARIGSENELGIKIRQVTPGASMDKTRIQLQKGDKAGWVTFADDSASQPVEVIKPAGIPSRTPGPGAVPPSPNPVPQRRSAPPPANPILPPPTASPNSSNPINDVPLPPP